MSMFNAFKSTEDYKSELSDIPHNRNNECSVWGCANTAHVAAHVAIFRDMNIYLTPMCTRCNNQKVNVDFNFIKGAKMVVPTTKPPEYYVAMRARTMKERISLNRKKK